MKTLVPEGNRQPLRGQINLKHPMVQLADLIDWEMIDIPDADALQFVEGNTSGRDLASAC
ncbi:hypothetical protein [Mycetohabitans sp. B46]|uniref:hypothetical protein n=1 Tax=Mycetohabitans sp. B46 TaxID=2772536 RepID=UPI00307F50C8